MRRFIDTSCHECVIGLEVSADPDDRWVQVDIFSSHDRFYFRRGWRGLWARLKMAWAMLQGEGDEWVSFSTPEQVLQFTDALKEALVTAWPEKKP